MFTFFLGLWLVSNGALDVEEDGGLVQAKSVEVAIQPDMSSLLEKVSASARLAINGSADSLDQTSLENLLTLFSDAQNTIKKEHKITVAELNVSVNSVAACNGVGAVSHSSSADSFRDSHDSCRVAEADLRDIAQVKCDAWSSFQASFVDACSLAAVATDYKEATPGHELIGNLPSKDFLKCAVELETKLGGNGVSAQALRDDCEQAHSANMEKHVECNELQLKYEVSWQNWQKAVCGGCPEHADCRSKAIQNHQTMCGLIASEAQLRKNQFESIEKAECFLKIILAIKNKDTPAPTETNISDCSALKVDTSEFDIYCKCDVGKEDAECPTHSCDAPDAFEDICSTYQSANWASKAPVPKCSSMCQWCPDAHGACTTTTTTPARNSLPLKTCSELKQLGYQCDWLSHRGDSYFSPDTPEDSIPKLCVALGSITLPPMTKSGTFRMEVCSRFGDGGGHFGNSEWWVKKNGVKWVIWEDGQRPSLDSYWTATKCSDPTWYAEGTFSAGDVLKLSEGYGQGCILKAEWW